MSTHTSAQNRCSCHEGMMTSVGTYIYVDCGVFMAITRESCIFCKEHVGQTTRIAGTVLHEPLPRLHYQTQPWGRMPCHSLWLVRIQALLMENPQHSRMGKVFCSSDDKRAGFRLLNNVFLTGCFNFLVFLVSCHASKPPSFPNKPMNCRNMFPCLEFSNREIL